MSKLELIEPKPIEKGPDDLLDMHDVARMLAVDISWVKNHCKRVKPLLPHAQFGDGRTAKKRFKRDDIIKFIDEHMVVHRKRA